MTFIKDCKPDFKKLKERVKSRPEVECTGKCYGCQAECIHKIPKIPEESIIEVLSVLEAGKIASEIQEKLPEETVKKLVSILEKAELVLENQNDY